MLSEKPQILVADDEANLRRVLEAQLTREGYEVHLAEDGERALEILRENHVDLVISDLRMPKLGGMDLLRAVAAERPTLPVVLITAHGSVETAVEALRGGAFDYITKPFDQDELRGVVRKALRAGELSERTASPQEGGTRLGMIGTSPALSSVLDLVERVADSPTTVLVMGESGTGKELVARALHAGSSRRTQPFIKVNCAAIPRDLLEAELFGYERGAFTGAVSSKPGRFELADGGTLLLDEIGDLPAEMQVKLLRALQEGEFERVGGLKTQHVDVRLIAATNRDLRDLISQGKFREDLYYRLHVVSVVLPSLRDRPEDIDALAMHFLKKYAQRLRRPMTRISEAAMARLRSYPWPGNVRELENVMERAVLFTDGDQVEDAALPEELRGVERTSKRPVADAAAVGLREQVKATVAVVERELIQKALDQTEGNVTRAARLLKISRKGLQLKMKELGLREGRPSLVPGSDGQPKQDGSAR